MNKIYTLILAVFFYSASQAQSWEAMSDIPADLAFPVVVELDGNIHVIGGGASGGATDIHLRYTPYTDSWDTLAPVPYLAQQPAGAVVNGKIHFFGGGYPNTGTPLASHYYYDPDSAQWYQAADLPFPVAIQRAAALDGKLYCLSGQPDKTLCEYYDPVSDIWTANDPLPDMDFWYGAVTTTTNTIYRFGGGAYFAPSSAAHEYDKVNDTWLPLPDFPEALHALAGAALNDSLICISGGYAGGFSTQQVWIYNINTQTYSLSDSLPVAICYHSMVVAGGCLYTVGGYNPGYSSAGVMLLKNCSPTILASVEENSEVQIPYTVKLSPESFTLTMHSPGTRAEATLRLIDAFGKTVLVKSLQIENGTVTINGGSLAAGMYIVLLKVDGCIYHEKWMVAH